MRILVVGGAGYIGSHCVRQIVKAGHEPVVLDNLVLGHRGAISPEIPFYEGDLGDVSFVQPILENENIDVVMHFAAYAAVGESVAEPLKYYTNNVAGTIQLLNAMKRAGVNKFIFSSTCATFGVVENPPIVETMPQVPINPYGQTKLDIENLLKAHAQAEDFRFAVFRYFNAAGAAEDGSIGEDHHPELHLIPIAIQAIMGQRPSLKVFGTDYPTPDGTCLRDYVHVDDLSRAHIAAFRLLNEPGTQLFLNLGVGNPSSVKEVIAAVEKVSGKTVLIEYADRRPGDPPSLYSDSTLAKKTLDWEPKYPDLESIVRTAWNWHSTHPNGYGD
ncbi:MAG: UDP-glucose 4-epimerase GalE [Verrucomicrobia bacterium]|nr:UDP-glucose 4-epimerase GalE [Verrucomicrobiota bacterium]MDA1065784.1 UDP-glucose 4-epimerase GalE [Verrucomicrobiota bacterium]